MKTQASRNTAHLVLLIGLTVSAAQAAKPVSWDAAPQAIHLLGSVTVTTKDGKKHKDKSVYFTPTNVVLVEHGASISREDVRDVVIREGRGPCCQAIWWATVPYGLVALADGGQQLLLAVLMTPIEAVTLVVAPAVAGVQGIMRLKPAKILYEVTP